MGKMVASGHRACLRQPMAHDIASAALPHGTRQMAQLGFVVKSPTTAAAGSACTAMSSSIEHAGSAGVSSWRSIRAEVLALADWLCRGSPIFQFPLKLAARIAADKAGPEGGRPTSVWVVPLQSSPSLASTDAVSARRRSICASSWPRFTESSEHFPAAFEPPSSGLSSAVTKAGKSATNRATSRPRETATDKGKLKRSSCEGWCDGERLSEAHSCRTALASELEEAAHGKIALAHQLHGARQLHSVVRARRLVVYYGPQLGEIRPIRRPRAAGNRFPEGLCRAARTPGDSGQQRITLITARRLPSARLGLGCSVQPSVDSQSL
jgi:hypothetical protein